MQLKRKGGPDDGPIVEDFISPILAKRPRQGVEFPAILEESMNVLPEVCPVEVPNDTPILEFPSTPPTLVITEPDAEDRAIVLYKPMNSSSYPQFQANAAFPHNFKGIQIPSGWSQALRQKLGYPLEDGSSSSNRLAVVPYMGPSTIIVNEDGSISGFARPTTDVTSYNGGGVIIEDITDQVRQEEEDAMQVEESAAPMDFEEEMAVDAMQDTMPSSTTQPFVQFAQPFANSSVPNSQFTNSSIPLFANSSAPQFANSSAPQFADSQFMNSSAPQFANCSAPQFANCSVADSQFMNSSAPQFANSQPQFANSQPQFANSSSPQFANSQFTNSSAPQCANSSTSTSPTWQMHHSPPYTPVMWSNS